MGAENLGGPGETSSQIEVDPLLKVENRRLLPKDGDTPARKLGDIKTEFYNQLKEGGYDQL
jgi:hypothetical protein